MLPGAAGDVAACGGRVDFGMGGKTLSGASALPVDDPVLVDPGIPPGIVFGIVPVFVPVEVDPVVAVAEPTREAIVPLLALTEEVELLLPVVETPG